MFAILEPYPYPSLMYVFGAVFILYSAISSSVTTFLERAVHSDTLRERLRTHKVLTKDQHFYLNYNKFSIKSYVLDVY